LTKLTIFQNEELKKIRMALEKEWWSEDDVTMMIILKDEDGVHIYSLALTDSIGWDLMISLGYIGYKWIAFDGYDVDGFWNCWWLSDW
jgi:hypothetical protein